VVEGCHTEAGRLRHVVIVASAVRRVEA
jgi:hypothetical protein